MRTLVELRHHGLLYPCVVDLPEELAAPRPRGGSELHAQALLDSSLAEPRLREFLAARERET